MKQSNLGWFLPILIVLLPLLGGLGWEGLQRYRFRAQAERLDAAVRSFQAGAVLLGEQGRPLPLASGRATPPYFKLETKSGDLWHFHTRLWTLKAVFVDPKGLWHPLRIVIQIAQHRNLMLRSPEFRVIWDETPPPSFQAEFKEALHDFTYYEAVAYP